ncbi:butyrophilin-like protein 10 [Pteropus vampyrus]|uniref:Butyrophilin-like protein 10 n=1 Tax=Pteropus vampyrus TaxID=132908 RepID=A0A6P3R2D5_PTEVA|nr:butyrophilin-like protein 10 [Pteropus vampyrus]
MGEDTELLCHLSLNVSIEDMDLRWYRDQPLPAMHMHRKGEDMQEEQMEWYWERTTFVRAGLAQGQAVVRIHNINAFDNGTFHCPFRDGAVFQEAKLWPRVAKLTVHIQVTQDEGVQAECTLADCYPEWRGIREQILPSVTNLSASPTTGLWTMMSSMTIPHDRTVGGLSCSISSPLLSERKVVQSPLPSSCPLSCSILASKVLKAGTYVPRCQDIRMEMRLVAGKDWRQIPIQVLARGSGAHKVLGADF